MSDETKSDFDYIDNWIYNHRVNDDDKEALIRLNNIYYEMAKKDRGDR